MKKYIVTKKACDKHKIVLKVLFLITYILFFPFVILAYIYDFLEIVLNFAEQLRNKIVYGIFKILFKKDCKVERRRNNMKQILDYGLELENVKESELPEKDNEKIIQFNNSLADKYGLHTVNVLENDNLYFRGRIISNTKSENNAKLKLLIAELNEFYKKYNLKKVIKKIVAYGHTL